MTYWAQWLYIVAQITTVCGFMSSSLYSCKARPSAACASIPRNLELWIDGREVNLADCAFNDYSASRILLPAEPPGNLPTSLPSAMSVNDNGLLVVDNRVVGRLLKIRDSQDVKEAQVLVGSVDWICLTFEEDSWIMIPLENIISVASDSPTRICAKVTEASQVQGVASALQLGVDALLIEPGYQKVWEAARKASQARATASTSDTSVEQDESGGEKFGQIALVEAKVESVENGGVGDRVCLDLIQMLKPGEGALVGSSALGLVLVQAEVMSTEYVPARPFRVNAGPVHSYVLLEDGSTKYLAEVGSGDVIRVVNREGAWRGVTVGRAKVESRPHVRVTYSWQDSEGRKESNVYLQQAETVRLCRPRDQSAELSTSVTRLEVGHRVLVRPRRRGTHIGRAVTAKVVER